MCRKRAKVYEREDELNYEKKRGKKKKTRGAWFGSILGELPCMNYITV